MALDSNPGVDNDLATPCHLPCHPMNLRIGRTTPRAASSSRGRWVVWDGARYQRHRRMKTFPRAITHMTASHSTSSSRTRVPSPSVEGSGPFLFFSLRPRQLPGSSPQNPGASWQQLIPKDTRPGPDKTLDRCTLRTQRARVPCLLCPELAPFVLVRKQR